MPLYQDVFAAAYDTVTKMLAHRGMNAEKVELDCGGGEGASMERRNGVLVLHLPSFAPDTELSRAEADRYVGFLVHEVAHWLHTNWSEWAAAAREGGFVRDMTNALEDLRIERMEQQAGVWRGFGAAMAALVNHMDRENQSKPGAKTLGTRAVDLSWLVALIGRKDCNGLDITGAERARAAVIPPLRPILQAALQEAGQTTSCADCHKLARKIARMVQQAAKQEAEAQPKAPPPAQPKAPAPAQPEAQKAQESQDTGQGGQDSQDSQDEAQEGQEGEGAEGEGAEGEGEGEGEQAGSGASRGTAPDDWADLEAAGAPAPDIAADPGKHAQAEGLSGMLTELPHFRVTPSPWGRDHTTWAKRRRDALPRSALLHDQIGQLVAAQEVRQLERRLTAGRFDRRAVARAAMGALDVCAHRHVTPGCNTAVCLLIDLSGSMSGGGKMAAAQTMAIHLSEAIDMAGGKSAVVGFGDPASRDTRIGHACQLHLFKDWTDSPALGARTIAGAATPYGTPLAPGMIAAARWMVGAVDADRYLLGALTDGECSFGVDAVQAACRVVTKLGVDLFALGCCHDTSRSFRGYPRADVFNVRDLPRVAMRTLLRQLEARA